jgi:hypothetical protein
LSVIVGHVAAMHIRIEGHEERLLAIFARLLAIRGRRLLSPRMDNLAPGAPCDFVDPHPTLNAWLAFNDQAHCSIAGGGVHDHSEII